ncbi:hypothetical protein ALC60_00575, partial [Trachymyrmex zeteki]
PPSPRSPASFSKDGCHPAVSRRVCGPPSRHKDSYLTRGGPPEAATAVANQTSAFSDDEERRWGDGGENLRRFHAWRAVRGGTGQPDWAASLASCTEGRQLPAGLPPPRIIRDKREREKGAELKQETFREGDKRG